MKSILTFLIVLAAGYLLIVLLMYLMQSKMIFHPQKELFATPAKIGLEYEDIRFKTKDKITLHGWFIPVGSAKPTVLFFHGNAGNISGRMETIKLLHELEVNLFIFDYRGYGQSEGSPTEKGTYQDALAAWQYLNENRNIAQKKIVIMGRSLGGSIAGWLAARKRPAAVIMESTFTSAADLGADLYAWLPVRWLLKYKYNTLEAIQKIDAPLFMAHSRDDRIVPFFHGRRLYDAANEPKMFLELHGSHGSGFLDTGTAYRNALKQFLES